MRSLRRDPAPSRWGYRLERLRLTPGVVAFLRVGLPLLLLAASAAAWLSDAGRRAALADGAAALREEIETRPEFMVTGLAVEGGSPEVEAAVIAAAGPELPASSLRLDLDAIRTAAEGVSAVARAAVHVRAGGILEIAVTERVPAVVWRSADGLWLLDGTGARVRAVAERGDRPDLPLLAGQGAEARVGEALALIAAAGPLQERVRGLLRIGARRWDLVLDPDLRVMLPEADPLPALERVVAMDEVQDLLSRDVTVVDFRNPERPTLRLREAAAQTFTATMRESLEPSR